MARACPAFRPSTARRLGRARRHHRPWRGARRAVGPSRGRAPRSIVVRPYVLVGTTSIPTRSTVSSGWVDSAFASESSETRRRRWNAGRVRRSCPQTSSPRPRASVCGSPTRVSLPVWWSSPAAGRGDRVRGRSRRQRRPPGCGGRLVAVHIRRGPWGRLQPTPPEAALGLDDLASLPQALASLA